MLSRLTRILLALVTAVVLSGQVEAAARHCARLVEQAAATQGTAPTADPPCHQAEATAGMHHSGQGPIHHKAPDTCQCVAALKMCGEIAEAQAAVLIAPYAWLSPEETRFASHPPEPDWRPPRA